MSEAKYVIEHEGHTRELDRDQADRLIAAKLGQVGDDARLHPNPGVSWAAVERKLAE